MEGIGGGGKGRAFDSLCAVVMRDSEAFFICCQRHLITLREAQSGVFVCVSGAFDYAGWRMYFLGYVCSLRIAVLDRPISYNISICNVHDVCPLVDTPDGMK